MATIAELLASSLDALKQVLNECHAGFGRLRLVDYFSFFIISLFRLQN